MSDSHSDRLTSPNGLDESSYTISGFEQIVSGQLDDIPEEAFYMCGSLDDVYENAKKMKDETH